jgi:hypothetical protein
VLVMSIERKARYLFIFFFLETLQEIRSVRANTFGLRREIMWKHPQGKLYDCVGVAGGPSLLISGEENLFQWDSRAKGSDDVVLYNSHKHEHHDYCIKTLETRGNLAFSGGGDSYLCSYDLRKERERLQRIRCVEAPKSCFVSKLLMEGGNLFAGILFSFFLPIFFLFLGLCESGFKTYGLGGSEIVERGFSFDQHRDFGEPSESILTCFDVSCLVLLNLCHSRCKTRFVGVWRFPGLLFQHGKKHHPHVQVVNNDAL